MIKRELSEQVEFLLGCVAVDGEKLEQEAEKQKLANQQFNPRTIIGGLEDKNFAKISFPDKLHAILGVEENCDLENISARVKKLKREFHPDRVGRRYDNLSNKDLRVLNYQYDVIFKKIGEIEEQLAKAEEEIKQKQKKAQSPSNFSKAIKDGNFEICSGILNRNPELIKAAINSSKGSNLNLLQYSIAYYRDKTPGCNEAGLRKIINFIFEKFVENELLPEFNHELVSILFDENIKKHLPDIKQQQWFKKPAHHQERSLLDRINDIAPQSSPTRPSGRQVSDITQIMELFRNMVKSNNNDMKREDLEAINLDSVFLHIYLPTASAITVPKFFAADAKLRFKSARKINILQYAAILGSLEEDSSQNGDKQLVVNNLFQKFKACNLPIEYSLELVAVLKDEFILQNQEEIKEGLKKYLSENPSFQRPDNILPPEAMVIKAIKKLKDNQVSYADDMDGKFQTRIKESRVECRVY